MINLMMPTMPADLPTTLQTLSDMLALLSDPAASKERIAEFSKVTADLRDAIDASKTERASFSAAQAANQQMLDQQRGEHDRKLAESKASFDSQCALASEEIRSQRDNAEKLEKQAMANAEAAAALKNDLQRRIDQIKAATA